MALNTPRPDTDIPKYIGLIDSDNSYNAVFGIGAYLLRDVTGVDYNPYHDGPWWRRWWERNKTLYSEAARQTLIPDIAKTQYALNYEPYPESLDTLEGKIEWVRQGCPSWAGYDIEYLGNALCEHNDARVIPVLVGWMLADESTRCVDMREESWERMTGIDTNDAQTPEWWAQWWADNKSGFPEDAQNTPIPDLTAAVASFRDSEKVRDARRQEQEFEGFPAEQRTIDGDEKQSYFQIGPREGATMPESGWKVMLILPGGDGSADFHPFCRRIHMHALPEDYVAVQLVAPVWSDDENRVVWPSEKLNPQDGEFTTEQFIKAAVEDLKTCTEIDEQNVFALGWSSGGPPLYVNSVLDDSPVTGTFVAMSVFHPQNISDISGAEGHPYFILHSPGDWIPIDRHARVAVEQLGNAGAKTRLQLYSGGHGWVDDPYGNIRRGIQWLQENVEGGE